LLQHGQKTIHCRNMPGYKLILPNSPNFNANNRGTVTAVQTCGDTMSDMRSQVVGSNPLNQRLWASCSHAHVPRPLSSRPTWYRSTGPCGWEGNRGPGVAQTPALTQPTFIVRYGTLCPLITQTPTINDSLSLNPDAKRYCSIHF